MQDSGKSNEVNMSLLSSLKSWLPFQTSNPEAFLGEGLAKQVGNVTECALLGFLMELGEYLHVYNYNTYMYWSTCVLYLSYPLMLRH